MKQQNHHNHARYKTTVDGRFVMWKSLHFGSRGSAGTVYIVTDSTDEFPNKHFDTVKQCECYVQFRVNGLELAPWFGSTARDGDVKDAVKLLTVAHPEYKEILGK